MSFNRRMQSPSTLTTAGAGVPTGGGMSASLTVDRRLVRRELLTWAKKVPLLVGLEVIAESMIGTEAVRSLLPYGESSSPTSPVDWQSSISNIDAQQCTENLQIRVDSTQVEDGRVVNTPSSSEHQGVGLDEAELPLDLTLPPSSVNCSRESASNDRNRNWSTPAIRVPQICKRSSSISNSTTISPPATKKSNADRRISADSADVHGTHCIPSSMHVQSRSVPYVKTSRYPKSSSVDQLQVSPPVVFENSPDNVTYGERSSIESSSRSRLTPQCSHGSESTLTHDSRLSVMEKWHSLSWKDHEGDVTIDGYSQRSSSGAMTDSPNKYPSVNVNPFGTINDVSPGDVNNWPQSDAMNSASNDSVPTSGSAHSSPYIEKLVSKFAEYRVLAELSERGIHHNRGLPPNHDDYHNVEHSSHRYIDGDRHTTSGYPSIDYSMVGQQSFFAAYADVAPMSGSTSTRIDEVLRDIIYRTIARRLEKNSPAIGCDSAAFIESELKHKQCNIDWSRFCRDSANGRRENEQTAGAEVDDVLSGSSIGSSSASSLEPRRHDGAIEGGEYPRRVKGRHNFISGLSSRHNHDNLSTSSGEECATGSSTSTRRGSVTVGSGIPKKTRPKRGQYRKYNRQLLMEAVRAVQQGDMSVHRAGSFYGVPHSTLEYKVKERHLLRQRKMTTLGLLNDDVSSSAMTSPTTQQQQQQQQQQPHDQQSSCHVRDEKAVKKRELSIPERRLDDVGLSESSRSYLKQLQDAANLAAAAAAMAASNSSTSAWPFLFDSTLCDESLPLPSAAAALFPWNYFLSPDVSGNEAMFSASAAVLSAAAAAHLPPLPPPRHPMPYGLFGNSLPAGFGWSPLSSTPLTNPTPPSPVQQPRYGVFSHANDPVTSMATSFDMVNSGNCHMFSMSASDLLKSFQLKVQAKSAAAAAAASATGRDMMLATADDCRMVTSSTAVDSFSDLIGSRCSSVSSVDSPTSQLIVS